MVIKKKYDIIIIGAGVVGTITARELSRYDLDILVIEKGADVCSGTSKANSAIIHAGYAAPMGSLKGELSHRGNKAYLKLCDTLDVPFKRIGSFVAAFDTEQEQTLDALLKNGIDRDIEGIEIITGEEARRLEPGLSDKVRAVLHAPTAGIINPFILTFALYENSRQNAVHYHLGTEVTGITRTKGAVTGVVTASGEYKADFVINAAGVYSDTISEMAGEGGVNLNIVKGEYFVSDIAMGLTTSRIVFPAPSKLSKGILVTPTTDGNILFGPTAHVAESKEDTATTQEGLAEIMEKAPRLFPDINFRGMITQYAGLRAKDKSDDFIIAASKKIKGFINAAGIQSPGLTAAPAIADRLLEIVKEEGLSLKKGETFYPARKGALRIIELSPHEIAAAIKKDPAYGHIVCRCESVSEGEVIDAINEGATTTDGVKFRRRAGSGRCQGGFCGPRVVDILSRELDMPMEAVTKNGGESKILLGRMNKGWHK
ncbi:MAG: NAD(P)/FAD-dependent oxidoreductase [Proteobacteria bacterium]|nr:NAD(P)/FAD-dependent oxidoreductase [Pseudomonadota bacterium]